MSYNYIQKGINLRKVKNNYVINCMINYVINYVII